MTFGFISAAWALLIIPILIFLVYVRFKDRYSLWEMIQQPKNWAKTISDSNVNIYFWRKVTVIAALMLIIAALMRPQFGEKYQTIERDGRQIFFVVDTSLSMLAEDGAKTRLDLAKYHMQQLISKFTDDLISIVPYSSTSYMYLPLTTDMSAVDMFVQNMSVGMIGSSGSNIMSALTVIKNTLSKKGNQLATIIVFSDGEFMPALDKSNIKSLFDGIPINSIIIGIGSEKGEPIPLRQDDRIINYKKDETGTIVLTKRLDSQLEQLAKSINGEVLEGVPSPIVAQDIYSLLSKIETQALEEKQLVTKIDRYHWLLLLALILLAFDYLSPKIYPSLINKSIIILLVISLQGFAGHPGVDAYNQAKYEDAELNFIEELQKKPNSGFLKYNLGNTYFKMGNFEKAAQAYKEAISNLPENKKIDAYYNIGTTYLNNNKLDAAIKVYKEVLSRDPNHLKAKQNIELALRQQNNKQQNNQQDNQKNDANKDQSSEQDKKNNENQGDQEENKEESSENENPNLDESETNNSTQDESETNNSTQDELVNNRDLSEQQIKQLVDTAEREALKKRQKIQAQLFKESTW